MLQQSLVPKSQYRLEVAGCAVYSHAILHEASRASRRLRPPSSLRAPTRKLELLACQCSTAKHARRVAGRNLSRWRDPIRTRTLHRGCVLHSYRRRQLGSNQSHLYEMSQIDARLLMVRIRTQSHDRAQRRKVRTCAKNLSKLRTLWLRLQGG